ncbi:MAG: cytochrome c3 family protein [Gemmatimonadota bacterium]
MNRTYRIAALLIGLMFAATAVVVLRPAGADAETPIDASLAIHQESQEAEDATALGEGQTADEARRYSVDQSSADLPPQWKAIFAHDDADKGPRQPIPFNHRFHTGDLQIDCMYCHTGTERSVSGVVPAMEVCMGCHLVAGTGLDPVEQMRTMYANGEPVEWKWVNKLPEFTQFSHRAHLRNDLECAECHGPVEEMDRVYQWASFKMGWCLSCHRSEPKSTDVTTDHIISQSVQRISEPGELQEMSFYPKAIDSDYGKFRGPTDCTACHY